jgi:hypothetical protein
MADDKKKAGEGSALFHKDHYKEVIYFLIPGLALIALILNRLLLLVDNLEFTVFAAFWAKVAAFFIGFWTFWKVFAVLAGIGGIIWAIYSARKLKELDKEEEKIYGKMPEDTLLSPEGGKIVDKSEEKWQKIVAHANSENPAEWRVAIMEADIMLEELLRASGYIGEGVGELLKSVDPSDMLTLDAAWEAHKVRNRIAHSGTDFDLTDRETRRIISLFESVFKEFGLI